MAVLGDNPQFLMDTLANSLMELTGGVDAPTTFGLIMFALLAYLALAYRLDRGALTLLGVMGIGIFVYMGGLPVTIWWAALIIIAPLAAYGVLNMLRQGDS